MKGRKAQAAMEFLMTYGWAILVVLVVIGALAYFGVLSPAKLLPDRCTLPPGISCDDYSITSGAAAASIIVTNALGQQLTITSFTAASPDGLVTCVEGIDAGNGNLNPVYTVGPPAGVVVPNSGKGTLSTLLCTGPLTPGQKQRLGMTIKYIIAGSTLDHTLMGDIYATVK